MSKKYPEIFDYDDMEIDELMKPFIPDLHDIVNKIVIKDFENKKKLLSCCKKSVSAKELHVDRNYDKSKVPINNKFWIILCPYCKNELTMDNLKNLMTEMSMKLLASIFCVKCGISKKNTADYSKIFNGEVPDEDDEKKECEFCKSIEEEQEKRKREEDERKKQEEERRRQEEERRKKREEEKKNQENPRIQEELKTDHEEVKGSTFIRMDTDRQYLLDNHDQLNMNNSIWGRIRNFVSKNKKCINMTVGVSVGITMWFLWTKIAKNS